MAAPISVIRVYPVLTTKHLGISVGDALFSDNQTIRFHTLSKSPPAVRLLSDRPMPEHERALVAWLEEQQHPPAAA